MGVRVICVVLTQNRELGILILLRDIHNHQNVIELKHHYEAEEGSARKPDKFLYLVIEEEASMPQYKQPFSACGTAVHDLATACLVPGH